MKIVILTYPSHQANLMTHRLITQFPGQVVGIVQSDVIVAGRNTLQSMQFLFQKTGLGFVIRKGMEIILGRAAAAFLGVTGKTPTVPSLAQMGQSYNIPIIGAKKVNAQSTLATIKSWQPDLIISVYLNQLIRAKLIKLAPQGVINIHPALLPKNRGLFPYFWALANGDAETGVTVHWVDTKFDTGQILVQQAIPIHPTDTVISLASKSATVGADLLVEAVKLIQAGNPPCLPQDTKQATYFSWPTPNAVHRFKQRGRKYGSLLAMWQELIS